MSIESSIDANWDELPVDDRLVFASPVPLNEEQRKILDALRHSDCRFLAIEGPPGCGKSHTIVAIVFEAILAGKSVLVLSDKKEALDVVEDKLAKVLDSVRVGDDFQNPILRLGRAGNTYGKILNPHALDAIRLHHRVARARSEESRRRMSADETTLKSEIRNLINQGESIALSDVAELQQREASLSHIKRVDLLMNDDVRLGALRDARQLAVWLLRDGEALLRLARVASLELDLTTLSELLDLQERLGRAPALTDGDLTSLRFFSAFEPEHHEILQDCIRRYLALKMPLVGFMFRRARAREVDQQLGNRLSCRSAMEAHRRLPILLRAEAVLGNLRASFDTLGIAVHRRSLVYRQIIDGIAPPAAGLQDIVARVHRLRDTLVRNPDLSADFGVNASNLDWLPVVAAEDAMVANVIELADNHQEFVQCFMQLPEFDYVGEKSRLESLHTQRLAHVIDERVVRFADQHKNLAKSLRDIVRKKQRFPRDSFEELKKAFPCIIAGIRDYAEYVPLERDMFDIVIIDEASQVSIAQAFPAFMRARKLVVLGDRRQFSNVKTVNASRQINTLYVNSVLDNFRRGYSPDTDLLSRLRMFDIRVSVLDFVERVANYDALLKKHFRGYPELISFSSQTFYKGQLQAVKIRGKKIDDVVRFTELDHDGKFETKRNINLPEAEAILAELQELAAQGNPPSVGVITPHTEQQAMLVQFVGRQSDGEHLNESLDLKIMTFDSCQGEERDVILYSMVASRQSDRLGYIFPKALDEADEVDHVLRLQRLNVGFSRAKERVHFFLSKPLAEFSGGIGVALRHFSSVLERGRARPEADQTDPRSPMEKKVLAWLNQTQFVQRLGEHVEIDPQFPVGEYLRQLDPTYRHPAYKVDFLLTVHDAAKSTSIIVEYDGFKEHFTDLSEVDVANYGRYMKAEDVERQKVLEAYGYRFLRLNRFNLGRDPVRTIDERLMRLAQDAWREAKPHALVETAIQQTTGLANGDMRQCSVCGQVKSIEAFRDMKLSRGYGRKCLACKREGKSRSRVATPV